MIFVEELSKRIERLEEKHAFAEHTADQVSIELIRAYEAIERLTSRLESLERRLAALDRAETDPEASGL